MTLPPCTVCGHTPSQDRFAGFCERLWAPPSGWRAHDSTRCQRGPAFILAALTKPLRRCCAALPDDLTVGRSLARTLRGLCERRLLPARMPMNLPARKIIHIDCDCFLPPWKCATTPEWRDVPLAVGGAPARVG